MKDDRLYLLHIKECIQRIEGYVRGGREEFCGSTLVQDAVLRNLHILSDLAYCWMVVERDLPPLKLAVDEMLED